MKRSFKCLPVGDLPYDTEKAATKMMVKLFENVPFLANLPNISEDETLLKRTLMNTPGITFEENVPVFRGVDSELKEECVQLSSVFSNPTPENLEQFGFDTFFLQRYYQIIERIKPAETVINLLGPFSLSQILMTPDGTKFIADKFCRKLLVQMISVKALWIINKIKKISPETKPLIMLEEPMLNKTGDIKREFETVDQDLIIKIFQKVAAKIKEAGANVGIQCFEKCDWQIPLAAGVDMISFDAYNNPNNLNIIPFKINSFLARGGRINWAIVPTENEKFVKSISADSIYERLTKTLEGLILAGGKEALLYHGSTVSILGSVNHLPMIFAEKALIVSTQVAKKLSMRVNK